MTDQILYLTTLKNILDQINVGFKADKHTHESLCILGARWLTRKNKCRAVLVGRGGGLGEMPDVIGFYYSDSFLIEAKENRADFLADAKKGFRIDPKKGMGKFRWYICPKDLIDVAELPMGWGLLYVSTGGLIKEIKAPIAQLEYEKDGEFLMLTSALATPWKLFAHWTEATIARLAQVRWMSKYTEEEIRHFCARLHANMIEVEATP